MQALFGVHVILLNRPEALLWRTIPAHSPTLSASHASSSPPRHAPSLLLENPITTLTTWPRWGQLHITRPSVHLQTPFRTLGDTCTGPGDQATGPSGVIPFPTTISSDRTNHHAQQISSHHYGMNERLKAHFHNANPPSFPRSLCS